MSHEKTRHSASEPASLQAASAGQLDAPLRAFVGYNIKRASEALRAPLNRVLKQFDLRIVTYSALTIICEHPGISQTQLADALSIERTRVVLLVDELEERGLITREKVRADRRAHSLEPTLHGRRLLERARKADLALQQALLAGFTRSQIDQLNGSLERIETAAKAMSGDL